MLCFDGQDTSGSAILQSTFIIRLIQQQAEPLLYDTVPDFRKPSCTDRRVGDLLQTFKSWMQA